jgi:hypothetical protein
MALLIVSVSNLVNDKAYAAVLLDVRGIDLLLNLTAGIAYLVVDLGDEQEIVVDFLAIAVRP